MLEVMLNVNNEEVKVQVGDKWTLMKVVREVLELKGTKCGCATNDCGACKVLIDGVAKNSCVVLAKKCEGKKIVTIEGIADGENLHPVQQAFVETGAIQCGFCTPGMVISVVGLLNNNLNPTEDDISKALDGNLCRCTGYVKIVEAVKLAAKRMGGEDVPVAKVKPDDERQIGSRMPLLDAEPKVRGEAVYLADIERPHMLIGKLLLSPLAHAKIMSIDTSEAEKLPGVKAIAHCFNTPMTKYNSYMTFAGQDILKNETVFAETVRFVGDRVAAVAAVDEETANEAIKLIKVEYEEMPVVVDARKATDEGAPEIWPGGNRIADMSSEAGDVDAEMEKAAHVFSHEISTQKVHHAAIELHASIAEFKNGNLTVWTPTQNNFPFRAILSEIFDMSMNKIKVIRPTVGGAFGGKLEVILEPVVAILAMKSRRPVKLEMTRKDVISASRCRNAAYFDIKTGVDENGRVVAQDASVIVDTGAYCSSAFDVTGAMLDKMTRVYDVPNYRIHGYPTYTNTQIAGAMRGYGAPEIIAAKELHLNSIARKLGYDQVEFRMKNLVDPLGWNYKYDETLGDAYVKECLEKGADKFGWKDKATRKKDEGRYRKGVGLACGVHGSGFMHAQFDYSTISIKMNEDGSCSLITGTHELGQGVNVTLALMASEVLGIPMERITVVDSDTDVIFWDNGAHASRSTWVAGKATVKTAEALSLKIRETASHMMNIPVQGLVMVDGCVAKANNPDVRVTLEEVVLKAQAGPNSKCLFATESYESFFDPGSYIADFAEVEVDTETGEVKVIYFVAAHDIGKAINPLTTEGQVHGGIQMGLGYATKEEILYDENGKPLNNNLKKYKLFKAGDMPKIDIVLVENGEKHGPFGAKSIGEAATDAVAPAVINAITDAIDCEFFEMPVTPEKILKALAEKA
jgi:CO/xanthine dehydrogenase Mo-binding subunit/aerobic-type carbon monoxide dehydrogenase small subunit (CoxS/CutS family)